MRNIDKTIETGVLRAFLPAKNFEIEKAFYREIGFEESSYDDTLSIFNKGAFSFYLQNYYVKDWADNSMMFLEVSDVDNWYNYLANLGLENKFNGIRFVKPVDEPWGRVCRMVSPSGVLWHFGKFKN